jgi:hypothetical protein
MEIAVKDFLKQDMKCGTVPLPSYYSYKIMKKGLLLAIERTDGTGALVKPTEWITSVQSQALKYGVPLGSDSQSFQVYEHYGDPLALRSFRMYGMRKCTKRVEKGGLGLGVLFPWVRFERDLVWVEEPHRGTWELSLSLEEPRTVMVKTFEKSTFWIQPSVYRWLWDRGFLFEDFSELG